MEMVDRRRYQELKVYTLTVTDVQIILVNSDKQLSFLNLAGNLITQPFGSLFLNYTILINNALFLFPRFYNPLSLYWHYWFSDDWQRAANSDFINLQKLT